MNFSAKHSHFRWVQFLKMPRSAILIEDASKSLPTIWMENSFPGWSVPGCEKIVPEAELDKSTMPPLRLAADFAPLDPLELPLPLPKFAAFVVLFPLALPMLPASAAHAAMAIEYASSPVEQPALHMRSVAGLSGDLRANS